MVMDEKRGIVFAATGSASDDFYGGERPGKNLYADSVLAIDANTGKLLWYFQAVHHDEWDDDFASPPVLVTVTRKGKKIDAVAATNKTGFVYVFDRVTGKCLFPIDEMPVPPATAPGDTAWPTQPLPRLPPPLSRQTVTAEDLTQRTPEANTWAREKFATFLNGPLFTPPAYNQETVSAPGFSGGDEWGGMTFDPKLEYLFVNTENVIWTTAVIDRKGAARADRKPRTCPAPVPATPFRATTSSWIPDGYPATAAPWGHLTAIDLKTGKFAWRIPFGEYPELVAKGMKNTGSESYGGGVATASGLFIIGGDQFRPQAARLRQQDRQAAVGADTALCRQCHAAHLYGGRQAVCGDRRHQPIRKAAKGTPCRLCLGTDADARTRLPAAPDLAWRTAWTWLRSRLPCLRRSLPAR